MSVSNHDKAAQHRRLEQRYGAALDNRESVRLLLSDYHALDSRRFKGDYAASDLLIDLHTAIERAGLTERQRQALEFVYFEDLTQEEAGKRMEVTKKTVNRLIHVAETKIARVYEYWARRGEGYALSYGMGESKK
jgi:RNA polymerase sigma factor (sigma-70 family)